MADAQQLAAALQEQWKAMVVAHNAAVGPAPSAPTVTSTTEPITFSQGGIRVVVERGCKSFCLQILLFCAFVLGFVVC